MPKTLILDNGSYILKAGYATQSQPHLIPNCITHSRNKTFLGELPENTDVSGLTFQRPHERGVLVDWRVENTIWNFTMDLLNDSNSDTKDDDYVTGKNNEEFDPTETNLIVTEAVTTLPQISSNLDQMVFEHFNFQSHYRCSPQSLVPWNLPSSGKPNLRHCALVVDIGFHSITIVPTILGEVFVPGIVQVPVGGRIMTGWLKERISFSQFNMMNETYLVNQIKEKTCYVAKDFLAELSKCKNDPKSFQLNYALPEQPGDLGHVLNTTEEKSISSDGQILRLTNDRFTIPELLFNPHHIDLQNAGISESIHQSLLRVPSELQTLFCANIFLTGGVAKTPGLVERLKKDLQPLVPNNAKLIITLPEDPQTYAWTGGQHLANEPGMLDKVNVTREMYMEYGERICSEKFNLKFPRKETEDLDGESDMEVE